MSLTSLPETQGFPGAADTFWATCQQIQILTSSGHSLVRTRKKAVQEDLDSTQIPSTSKKQRCRHFQDILFMKIVVQLSNFHAEQIFRGVSKEPIYFFPFIWNS